jgi:hypothetical protein
MSTAQAAARTVACTFVALAALARAEEDAHNVTVVEVRGDRVHVTREPDRFRLAWFDAR